MTKRATILLLALVACGDDDEPTQRELDSGLNDAGRDASLDARVGDSGASCSLGQTYKFYLDGGLSPLRDVYTVTNSGTVKVDRVPGGAYMDAGTYSCSASLGACGGTKLNLTDFNFALSGVDRYWGDGRTVYGADDRPSDGSVIVVERADGRKILVGGECTTTSAPCELPAAVRHLQTVFNRLRNELPLGAQDGGLVGSCMQ